MEWKLPTLCHCAIRVMAVKRKTTTRTRGVVDSGGWELLGNDKHPCIHYCARFAPADLEPCEAPVDQTSLTRRETTAREKTDITPTLACDHSHCIFVVLVIGLVSETALYKPAIPTPQQFAYVRRAISLRRASHSTQPTCLHCPPQRLRTKLSFRWVPAAALPPPKKDARQQRQLWRGGRNGGGVWDNPPPTPKTNK